MPFFEERPTAQPLTRLHPVDAETVDPSLAQTFGAAFRTQNVVGSFLSSRGQPDPYAMEDGFDSIDYIKDDPAYAPYADRFAGVFNRRAADALKMQIDQEAADRRTLDAAGWTGTLAEMAAGVVDLPSLLPVGGVLASGLRSTAGRFAVGAALDASASEIGLQATQATRTGEETALNIGGSIILGGALGALAGRYLDKDSHRVLSRKIEAQADAFQSSDQALRSLGRAQSAGAAAADAGPLRLKDEALLKRLYGVNQQDPMIRLQLSELDEARTAVRGLAETPLEYAENSQGIATEAGGAVETRMKMWNAPLASTLRSIDVEYARYFHGSPEPTGIQISLSPARSEFARRMGKTDKLTYSEFKREVGRAAFAGEQHEIPEVASAARRYREIDERMKRAAIEAGLFPEDVSVKGDVSHLFRMYDREKIIAERSKFSDVLFDHFKAKRDAAARLTAAEKKADKAAQKADEFGRLTDGEVSSIVDETVDAILGNAEGRVPYDSIVSGPRGPLKERLLQIESARIADFMELDIESVLHAQVRTMSADVELTRKFGSVDLKEQIAKINDEANRKIASATDAKQRQKLDKARKAAIRDVEGIRDRLRGQYRLPDNPDGLVLRAGRIVRNLNYLRLLGGMTVSAIPDMGKLVFSHGLAGVFRDGFMPLVTNLRAVKLAAQDVKDAGTALDMVLDSRTMAMADITNEFGRHSALERGLKAATSKFGVVSLMAPWNAAMKQFSGLMHMTAMLRAAERVAKGAGAPDDIRKLAASGIDPDMASRIADQFAKHGDSQGSVLLAKARDWDDSVARDAFRAAVVREVDKTIVTPGQDKPLWMSTEIGKIIGQFKSFGISSMQKTTLAGLQQRDAAVLNGLMTMLALGALTYQVKTTLSGKETSSDPRVWAVEAFDRAGIAGWLMEVNNITEKVTRGTVGLSAITGKQVSRYANRNTMASLLGPSLGTVQDLATVVGSAASGEYGEADARRVRQLLPAQNLFYVRTLFDQIEKTMGGQPAN